MDKIVELLLKFRSPSPCWEDEEPTNGNYDLENMRKEFQERMCTKMEREYPEFIWTFEFDSYRIHKLKFVKKTNFHMLKYINLCEDFDDDERETLVRTDEIIYKGGEMYEFAHNAYWEEYSEVVEFVNKRIDRVIEHKKKEIEELKGKKIHE